MILDRDISKLTDDSTILIAVSGGIDSMVLLDAMRTEAKCAIVVLHVDHQLRAGSAEEALFVEQYCKTHHIQCALERLEVDTRHSLQLTARTQRHALIRRSAARFGIQTILTAHHLDDYLENLFIKVGRGGGIGSMAFEPVHPHPPFVYLRPLYKTSRKEIHDYATTHGLTWREDPSNKKDTYLRNRIRLNFKELRNLYGEGLKHSEKRIRDAAEIVKQTTKSLFEESLLERGPYHIRFNVKGLQKTVALGEFLRYVSASIFGEHLTYKNIEDACLLIAKGKKGKLSLKGIELVLDGDLILRKNFGRGDAWWQAVNENFSMPLIKHKTHYSWFEWNLEILKNGLVHKMLEEGKCLDIKNWKRGLTRDGVSLSKIVKTHPRSERWKVPCLFRDDALIWIAGQKQERKPNAQDLGLEWSLK